MLSKQQIIVLLALLSYVDAFSVDTPPPVPREVVTTVSQHPVVATVGGLPSHRELLSSSSIFLSSTSNNLVPDALVNIADINFDGKVPTVESDEYVVVYNGSKTAPVDISGYSIYVATTGTQGPTFVFPKDTILKPGGSFRVYTNEIHKETGGFSFGSGKAIWNNRGGLAVMKDASGKKICEYKYKPADA
ncbi:hypothetical protein ACA910_006948 [Epithemia clementina (nom. ined.)]